MTRIKEVFALFALRVDGGVDESRLTRWRPLLELCRLPDFAVDTLHLFYKSEYQRDVEVLTADITAYCPGTRVIPLTGGASPEDFGELYVSFYQFFSAYSFDLERRAYYLYLPPGVYPHVTLALMDIVRILRLPLEVVQLYQYSDQHTLSTNYSIYSMDVSVILERQRELERQYLDDQQFLKSGIVAEGCGRTTLFAGGKRYGNRKPLSAGLRHQPGSAGRGARGTVPARPADAHQSMAVCLACAAVTPRGSGPQRGV